MTPLQYYQQQIDVRLIRVDANQYPIIEKLDALYHALIEKQDQKKGWFQKNKVKTPIKGIYLWGSVGIGKTFLLDCFYHTLPIPKIRMHFHAFMRRTQESLKQIQGTKNPLEAIAKQIADETRVICFDEFFVSDITDAMILGELFRALFDQGVTLVTTSNTPPDLLYKEGLQRERFLPAIALIKQHTDVIHLHTKTDYRRNQIQQVGVYYTPLDKAADKNMENCFLHFSNAMPATFHPITICNRPISIVKQAGTVVWFDFDAICGRPRSQNDYLDITKQYHTILLSGLRALKPTEKDLILSFVYLVDILYDSHCRLIISASAPLDQLFISDGIDASFQRTLSRLVEMQSQNYIYPESSGTQLTQI